MFGVSHTGEIWNQVKKKGVKMRKGLDYYTYDQSDDYDLSEKEDVVRDMCI